MPDNKDTNRDRPLADSPDPGERKPYLTKKDYKEEKRQARWQHNIEAAREGRLADERIDRASKVVRAVGDAAGTVTGVAAVANALKKGGNSRSPKGYDGN